MFIFSVLKRFRYFGADYSYYGFLCQRGDFLSDICLCMEHRGVPAVQCHKFCMTPVFNNLPPFKDIDPIRPQHC